ncbi:MAG: hypothetical protein QOH24_784 [Verrucomicrobiota bacterium]
MLMNGQTGGENREVKIDAGKTGESERNAQQIESFHASNMSGRLGLVTRIWFCC